MGGPAGMGVGLWCQVHRASALGEPSHRGKKTRAAPIVRGYRNGHKGEAQLPKYYSLWCVVGSYTRRVYRVTFANRPRVRAWGNKVAAACIVWPRCYTGRVATLPPSDDWLTLPQAAELLGVNRQRVGQLIDQGRLIACYAFGRRLVSRESVESLERRRPGRPPSRHGN